MTISNVLSLIALGAFSLMVRAEPWLASRFAQNCASCHSPGRVNPPETSQRRCSFTCKACHTNPSGGGIRNFYGKWNQERWLRSMYSPRYMLNKPRPHVTAQQAYQEARLKSYISGIKDPKDVDKLEREGLRLVETHEELPESEYDRRSTPAPTVEDLDQVKLRIPAGDPYRLSRANYFNAGVDFRWFYLNSKNDVQKKEGMVPMATDLGATVQPIQNLNFVWESRFMTDTRTASVWDQAYTTGGDTSQPYAAGASVRSAYVMADNLPWNTYAMYGIYRPMFGTDSADHTTLFALATGLGPRAAHKGGGIGMNRNFPFVNLNVLEPFADRTMPQDRGLVFTVGGHFVPAGSYLRLSWWDTKSKDWAANIITSRRRQSLVGGFTKWRLSMRAAVTNLMIDVPNVRRDTGTLISADPRVRIWKETYVKGTWEYLNTSPTLKFGKADQMGIGIGAFLLSGMEFEIMYKKLKYTELGVPSRETNWWSQLHLYF